jgi:DNA polymerase I-like protein with 3'-5' exonuclease and polymerase domains
MGIFAADIETSGLIDDMMRQENPRLHNLGLIAVDTEKEKLFEGIQKKEIQEFFNTGPTLIMHNGKLFDAEALAFLGYDVSKVKVIDTLPLSWYLEPQRLKHGLAEWGEFFGVPKPVIEDWENQTQEEYNHRVMEDCKIQVKLWHYLVKKLQVLYGKEEGSYDKLIAYMMWKMDELVIQQRNRWKLDVPEAEKLQAKLEEEVAEKTVKLIEVMPQVPVYVVKSRPAKPFKKNGDLSSHGEKWKELTESLGLPFEHTEDIKVVKEMIQGNPASHVQMKAWLDSLGWEPETFKFVKEDDGSMRQIPQINLKGGEICQSVKDLIPKCAGIEHIAGLGILNHRVSVVKGFLRDAVNGELTARASGFTNTLRLTHKECVNLPSLRVKYGKELRGLLMARPKKVLLGSDLSSLEDRLKHHFQWKLDPEYVKTQMSKGFDPHLTIAVIAGLLSQEDAEWYVWYKGQEVHNDVDDTRFKRLDEIRATGKSTNYACQYGAGVKTIARTAKVSEKIAKKLHAAYHKMNWSIAKIASMTLVKKTDFGMWQKNPINGMWYSLREEKDRFSTLIQGTGAYILDIWLYHAKRLAEKRNLDFNLLGQFHDEKILELDEDQKDAYHNLVADAMQAVNNQLKLNRELACDIKFGKKYSDIH